MNEIPSPDPVILLLKGQCLEHISFGLNSLENLPLVT
jgi:hypothetical protein